MIRIINESTFGYWNGKSVEPKTKNSDPFCIDPKREAELVELGVAEYADGDAGSGDIYDTADKQNLESWDYNDLRKLAADMGIEPEGKKKEDYIKAIEAAELEADTEAAPVINAEEAVV